MKTKFLAATAFTVAMAASAFAQNAPGNGGPPWDDDINGAFYSDTAAGTMRPDEEMKKMFMALSADNQAKVKADCAAMEGKNVGAGNGSGAADANVASTGADSKNMQKICGMAKGM